MFPGLDSVDESYISPTAHRQYSHTQRNQETRPIFLYIECQKRALIERDAKLKPVAT